MKIELYGDVVSDEYDWLYSLFEIPHCCPKNVRDAMKELPEDEDLILEVNSPGGDVWAGFEIYGMLQKLQGRTWRPARPPRSPAPAPRCSPRRWRSS